MLPQFGKEQENLDPTQSAAERLHQRRQLGRIPSTAPPKTVIFCYYSPFVKEILKKQPHQICEGSFSKLYFLTNYPSLAISDFGIGISTAATKMEELIAWGVDQFISIAAAGTLQLKAQMGDIVVCEKAVRDEEISNHYLPTAKYIHAPRRMTNKLQQELKKTELSYHIGSSWTTSSLSEQMKEEIQHYQREGVLTIDREAATLFAIAHFYQVDLGSLLTINSSLTNFGWQSPLEETLLSQGLYNLLEIAIEAAQR